MSEMLLIPGGGDVVSVLESALEKAKVGELVGVVICGIAGPDSEPFCGWAWGCRDDIQCAWARLTAITSLAHIELTTNGLEQ